MAVAIRLEHHPEDTATPWYAFMYEDDVFVPGTGAMRTERQDALTECADKYEQIRNADPVEWVAYTPPAHECD